MYKDYDDEVDGVEEAEDVDMDEEAAGDDESGSIESRPQDEKKRRKRVSRRYILFACDA